MYEFNEYVNAHVYVYVYELMVIEDYLRSEFWIQSCVIQSVRHHGVNTNECIRYCTASQETPYLH